MPTLSKTVKVLAFKSNECNRMKQNQIAIIKCFGNGLSYIHKWRNRGKFKHAMMSLWNASFTDYNKRIKDGKFMIIEVSEEFAKHHGLIDYAHALGWLNEISLPGYNELIKSDANIQQKAD